MPSCIRYSSVFHYIGRDATTNCEGKTCISRIVEECFLEVSEFGCREDARPKPSFFLVLVAIADWRSRL